MQTSDEEEKVLKLNGNVKYVRDANMKTTKGACVSAQLQNSFFFFISTTQMCYYKYYSSNSFDSTFILNII